MKTEAIVGNVVNLGGFAWPSIAGQAARLKPERLYLAGKMRGKPQYNFPAFEKAATMLRSAGYLVVSPAEMDLALGFDPDNDRVLTPAEYEEFLQRDFEMLKECDGIALIDEWETSSGTQREIREAIYNGIRCAPVQWWIERSGQ